MRVLIVHPRMYVYGGAEHLIVQLVSHLRTRGIRTALLTTGILPEIRDDLPGADVLCYPFESRGSWYADLFRNLRSLHRGIKRYAEAFDVVHVHNTPAECAVTCTTKPVVWMCNEPPDIALGEPKHVGRVIKQIFLALERRVVRRHVSFAVVADEFNASRFRGIYGFSPEIIPYGVDHHFFSHPGPADPPEALEPRVSFTILQVGMLTPFKNQIESLRTLEKVRDAIPGVRLVLAGMGEKGYLGVLRKYAHAHNLEGSVVFTGHLDRRAIRSLYHRCDVLLHPIGSQGGWLSPMEALCAGMPIVVSPEMSASDMIRREGIGTVTRDFAEAVLAVYQDRERYRSQAQRGERFVRERLTWDRFGSQVLSLLYRAVRECPKGGRPPG